MTLTPFLSKTTLGIGRVFMTFATVLLCLALPSYALGSDSALRRLSLISASKYISEGRDNLNDSGLVAIEGAAQWQGATFGIWYGSGESEAYDELNISVEYGFELDIVDVSVGYTRLAFLEDSEHDNEFNVSLAVNHLPWVTPGIDYVYSTEANGAFVEISLRSKLEPINEQLSLELYLLEGFDFGYASDDYDGPNHLQAGIEFTTLLTEQLNLVGSLAHSHALEDVKREGLGHKTWIALGLAFEF